MPSAHRHLVCTPPLQFDFQNIANRRTHWRLITANPSSPDLNTGCEPPRLRTLNDLGVFGTRLLLPAKHNEQAFHTADF